MAVVRVELGPASYDISIGEQIWNQIGFFLKEQLKPSRLLLVTDEQVFGLYGEQVQNLLQTTNIPLTVAVLPAGETAKSMDNAMTIYTRAIEGGLDRKSAVVALGGGVVGDMAGFVAATYLRGIAFVQIPTTLLAQVDSSVGGKVAVNHPLGKNLIGAFYQPKAVFAELTTLRTLPRRELVTGLAEVIKYGVIADPALFARLEDRAEDYLAGDSDLLTDAVERSCHIKADIVGKDERESSLRMLLNFGHTIGHAVEAFGHYAVYTHGEGVAIGMYGAARIAEEIGVCEAGLAQRIRTLCGRFGLPWQAPDCQAAGLVPILYRDKKAVGGTLQWVLPKQMGECFVTKEVPLPVVEAVLKEITNEA